MESYASDSLARKREIENSIVTLNVIEFDDNDDSINFHEIITNKPNEKGIVHKISFPQISSNIIFVLSVRDQWDLWLGSNTNKKQRLEAEKFCRSQIPIGNLQVVKQGLERILFREQFTPDTNFSTRSSISSSTSNASSTTTSRISGDLRSSVAIKSIDSEVRIYLYNSLLYHTFKYSFHIINSYMYMY